jgi:hypothetical protein
MQRVGFYVFASGWHSAHPCGRANCHPLTRLAVAHLESIGMITKRLSAVKNWLLAPPSPRTMSTLATPPSIPGTTATLKRTAGMPSLVLGLISFACLFVTVVLFFLFMSWGPAPKGMHVVVQIFWIAQPVFAVFGIFAGLGAIGDRKREKSVVTAGLVLCSLSLLSFFALFVAH